MAYAVVVLVVGGLLLFVARRSRRSPSGKSPFSDAVLGFARSMDKTSLYAGARITERK